MTDLDIKITPFAEEFIKDFYKEVDGKLEIENRKHISILIENFMGKVSGSFSLFKKDKDSEEGKIDSIILLNSILSFNGIHSKDMEHLIFNCDNYYKLVDGKNPDGIQFDVHQLKYKDSTIFPFLYKTKDKFKVDDKDLSASENTKVKELLEKYVEKEYGYLYIFHLQDYVLVFSKFDDLISKELISELENSYKLKLVDIQSVVPHYIEDLKKRIEEKKASIKEVGVHFPLSLIGGHHYINDKFKDTKTFFSDKNFKNLVRYGLLSKIKINKEYTITLNKNNFTGKFNLSGSFIKSRDEKDGKYLYDITLLSKIEEFLKDIERSSSKSSGIDGIPMFIIHKSLKTSTMPDLAVDLTLKLYGKDTLDIEEEFQIISIFPKYTTERMGQVCILRNKDEGGNMDLADGYLNTKDFGIEISFLDILNKLLKRYKRKYYYRVLDENEDPTENNKSILANDLLLLAQDKDGDTFLIEQTIKNPGKAYVDFSFDIYKLSMSDKIDLAFIEEAKITFDSFAIKLGGISNIQIRDTYDTNDKLKNSHSSFLKDGITHTFISEKNKTHKTKSGVLLSGYTHDNKLKRSIRGGSYNIDLTLPEEDVKTMFLGKVLNEEHGAKRDYYFLGKKKGGEYVELADMIGFYIEDKCHIVELFHMKLSPFQSNSSSTRITGSFSQYTEVLGQILQKLNAVIYEENLEDIISNVEKYSNPDYKGVFDKLIKHIRDSNGKKVKIKISFPIRNADYFDSSKDELALKTNWNSLKLIHNSFKSNIDNIAFPNLNIEIDLNLLSIKKDGDNFDFNFISLSKFFNEE